MSLLGRFLCALSGHELSGPVLEKSWEPGGWRVRRYCVSCRRVVTLFYPDGSGG